MYAISSCGKCRNALDNNPGFSGHIHNASRLTVPASQNSQPHLKTEQRKTQRATRKVEHEANLETLDKII